MTLICSLLLSMEMNMMTSVRNPPSLGRESLPRSRIFTMPCKDSSGILKVGDAVGTGVSVGVAVGVGVGVSVIVGVRVGPIGWNGVAVAVELGSAETIRAETASGVKVGSPGGSAAKGALQAAETNISIRVR